MANEKIFDMTKSAAANEAAVNNKFDELSQQGGGGSISRAESKPSNHYSSYDYGMSVAKEGNVIAELRTIFNSVQFNEELAANRVWTQTSAFAHGSALVAGEDAIYCTHIINPGATNDSPYVVPAGMTTKVMLYAHDLDTLAQRANIVVAERGDTVSVNGETYYIVSGTGCPQAFPITGGVRIIFVAGLHANANYAETAERVWYTFYRDFSFNPANNTLTGGTIGVCTISGELMNNANIATALGRSAFNDQNRTIAMVNQYAKRTENNVDYYYIGIAYSSELRNGVILRTTDFKDFTVWWQLPDLPLEQTLKFEFTCYNYYYYGNNYYLAMGFRTNGDDHLIWLVDWAEPHTTKVAFVIPTCSGGYGGRSCWLPQTPGTAYTLQMIYDTPGYARTAANVLRFDTPNGASAKNVTSVIAQTYCMSYPSVVYYNGYYYVSYTDIIGGHKAVCVSKFSPFKFDGKNVIPTLAKMLETFAPEES